MCDERLTRIERMDIPKKGHFYAVNKNRTVTNMSDFNFLLLSATNSQTTLAEGRDV